MTCRALLCYNINKLHCGSRKAVSKRVGNIFNNKIMYYNNQKEFRNSVILTIVGTIVYVVYLLVLSHYGKLPVEKRFEIQFPTWIWGIDLKTPISYWWTLLFAPAVMLLLAYKYSYNELVGREPNSKCNSVEDKHEARVAVYCVSALVMAMWIGCSILVAIFSMWVGSPIGPLTAFVTFGMYAAVAYVIFGFFVETMTLTVTDFSSWMTDRKLTEKYMSMVVRFLKMGFLITFPFLLGLTTGFLIRYVFDGIVKFFRAVKLGFKTQATN